jgi:hypothetical protein
MKKSKHMHKLAAAIVSGAIVSGAGDAFATGNDMSAVTDKLIGSALGIPKLITMVAYICGIALAVAGIFKLKQHVDNPGQTPMKDGLMRLTAGGALLALPFLTDAMQGSVGDNAQNLDSSGLEAVNDTTNFGTGG